MLTEPESPREPSIDTSSDPAAKALRVHARLCQTYGCPIWFFGPVFLALDPLSELVASLSRTAPATPTPPVPTAH